MYLNINHSILLAGRVSLTLLLIFLCACSSHPDALDMLNNIRLGTMLEESKKTGKPKATYMLEEMTEAEKKIMTALGIENAHNERPKIKDVGVYK